MQKQCNEKSKMEKQKKYFTEVKYVGLIMYIEYVAVLTFSVPKTAKITTLFLGVFYQNCLGQFKAEL